MTESIRSLEDVLDEIVATSESPEKVGTTRWSEEYPQYSRQILDFLASWTIMRAAAASASSGDSVGATQTLRGMSIVQNLMHEYLEPPNAVQAPLKSLMQRAQSLGLDASALARKTDLGEVVLRKLDRRLISPLTIPRPVTVGLAETLRTTDAVIFAYLQQPPTLARAARFRAAKAPAVPAQEEFADAVRTDTTMSEDQRAGWLSAAAGLEADPAS